MTDEAKALTKRTAVSARVVLVWWTWQAITRQFKGSQGVLAQIRSRFRLKRSVLVGVSSSCLRNVVVIRQNFNPAATANTVQGTSIQMGWSITVVTPKCVPSPPGC